MYAGPFLESKGKHATFQQKGQKLAKMAKMFKNVGKNKQNLKIL